MTTINLAESQNLPIHKFSILNSQFSPPGLLRQDTKLAGLIKKPSLRLCGRRHQVSANARIEEKPCQEHQTSQKQNPLRSPRLNFFVLIYAIGIRVNLCPCALGNSLHHRWYSWLNTINNIRYTTYASRFTKLSLYICRESSTNPPFLCKTKPIY